MSDRVIPVKNWHMELATAIQENQGEVIVVASEPALLLAQISARRMHKHIKVRVAGDEWVSNITKEDAQVFIDRNAWMRVLVW